jgi:hypothetical protein
MDRSLETCSDPIRSAITVAGILGKPGAVLEPAAPRRQPANPGAVVCAAHLKLAKIVDTWSQVT